ncbi:MAG TPA: glycolate oxidase subunit GlcE [Pseudomonadales bacterium]|nr:glycolate oxidase subunit GlcE [Pseudomonadales bacterium]
MTDVTSALVESVGEYVRTNQPVRIRGGDSKLFLGETMAPDLPVLDVSGHCGIVSYEPEELVLRARCGTRIAELQSLLASEGQMLGFEPPDFDGVATLGGTIAAALSGPRRPWFGAARDFVLGAGIITGEAEHLSFGGQVMKNVAGFDVSRLTCGAMGTLGVITDVSLKVLPAPRAALTLAQELDAASAHRTMVAVAGQSLPVSATCWFGGRLYIRLSGSEAGVKAAAEKLGGEPAEDIWSDVMHLRLAGLPGAKYLWRVSVPQDSIEFLDRSAMIEWGGAQRWLVDPDFDPREGLDRGHATLFKAPNDTTVSRFTPLSGEVLKLHGRLKKTFDPRDIFNPGRLYRGN